MATEKIQTELVITNLAHSQQSQQDLQGAIQAQQLLSAGPRKQLAQSLAGSGALGDETKLLNAFARMMGVRAGSLLRTAGTPVPTGRDLVNRRGEVMLDEQGNPIPEMQTPTVSARVRSDPNAHRSERSLKMRRTKLFRKFFGKALPGPSEDEAYQLLERATSSTATDEEIEEATELLERYKQNAAETARAQTAEERRAAGVEKRNYKFNMARAREAQRAQEKEAREAQKAQEREERATARQQEQISRRNFKFNMSMATEKSRYDQQALKDIDQIEKDVEATRKRLDTTKMRERLDAANAKLTAQPGVVTRAREQVLDYISRSTVIPFSGRSAATSEALRRQLTPLQEREMRFRDMNKELEDKVSAYRKLSRDERVAPEGREALAELKKDKTALKEEAADLKKEQTREEERVRLENRARAERYQAVGRMFERAAGDTFDPNRSATTTGLLEAGKLGATLMQKQGFESMLAGGGPGKLVGGLLAGAVVNLLKSGFERGTELQTQAEKVYTAAEPMFAREDQLRAARGLTSVRQYSREAQKRADAAQRRLGTPDLETAASGTPDDIDIYSKTTSARLKTLQQNLGSIMGLSAATQAYSQFRRQAGITDMSTADASLAMKTGFMAGTPVELLARAAQLGAIRGNRGGGPRTGLDQSLDIGTVRYQQETLGRAGLMGAPAEAILGQTLSRQEAMAALGMRTDFDRDAKFQRVLQESNISPQQFGTITGGIDETRMGLLQQLQAPGKEIVSGLMMADAFRRGKTVTGAAEYLAKTSSAEILENQLKTIGPGTGLLPLVAMSMAPADQPSMMEALRRMREGQTAGPAAATGEGTIDAAATERGRLEYAPEFSAIGAQRSMGKKAEIAEFQQTLDSAAKGLRAAADAMQSVTASVGNFFT